MRPLKLTRTQVKEKAARDIKVRTNARLTALIKEVAAERRLQYRRDQEQEDNQQPREQEDNQQPRESWTTCLNVSCSSSISLRGKFMVVSDNICGGYVVPNPTPNLKCTLSL